MGAQRVGDGDAAGVDRRRGGVDRAEAVGVVAAARQLRHGGQCLLGAAEVVDQFAEGDGADVVGADEPQARQTLRLAKLRDRERRGEVREGVRRARQFWVPRQQRAA